MAKPTVKNPALHAPAMSFIAEVDKLHRAGGGTLSLLSLARLFNLFLFPGEAGALKPRDAIALRPSQEPGDGGAFENRGQEYKLKRFGLTVVLPPRVAGVYSVSAAGFRFVFEPAAALYGHGPRGLSRPRLKELRLSETEIDLDLSDETHSRLIIHG
jgi:hypothetical protein